jgi:hypothetical protein
VSSLPPVEIKEETMQSFPKPSNRRSRVPLSDQETESSLRQEMDGVFKLGTTQERLNWAEKTLRHFHSRSKHEGSASKLRKPPQSGSTSEEAHELHSEAKRKVESLEGEPKALFIAARWFGFEPAKSLLCYQRAATAGYLRANYYLGRHYERAKQSNATERALQYYSSGADGGDTACKYVRSSIVLVTASNLVKVLAQIALESAQKRVLPKKDQIKAAIQRLCVAAEDARLNRDMDCPDPVYVSDAM